MVAEQAFRYQQQPVSGSESTTVFQSGYTAEADESGAQSSEVGTVDALTADGRSVKHRTTKANGAVVIGHMEVHCC